MPINYRQRSKHFVRCYKGKELIRLFKMKKIKKLLQPLVVMILQLQVRRLVKKHHPLVVAITGSVGKTSTKLAVAKMLAAKYRVAVHPGNFNTDIGLPLAIFDLDTPSNP